MSQQAEATQPARGEIAFDRPESGTLRIRLSGEWRIRAERSGSDAVERELDVGPTQRVVFDTGTLTGWDTALLTVVARVLEVCRARNVTVDRASLPTGVQRLLGLAEAVPEKEVARVAVARDPLLARVGLATLAMGQGAGEFFDFIGQTTIAFGNMLRLRARFQLSELFVNIEECGARALPIVTLISFLLGLILAFMGAVQLERFGASIYVADLVALAMTREMGAVMTAIIMSGRTGAAFAAQLGTMKVTEEIDALKTFGLSPMEFLVLPRMTALLLMMPLLCVYADLVGILGGAVVAVSMLNLSPTVYVQESIRAVTLTDFGLGIFKSGVFGALIAFSGCLRGMQCGSSASAVGDAATRAVVTSIVFIIVVDGLFAVLTNILGI